MSDALVKIARERVARDIANMRAAVPPQLDAVTDDLLGRTETKGNARDSGYARHQNDWYQEGPEAVDMLLDVEQFDGLNFDPACGGGNIPQRMIAHGLRCDGFDLIDRGYGYGGHDFLSSEDGRMYDGMVCNPPFAMAQKFVERAFHLGLTKIAIIQRLAFLEGQERGKLFRATPPARVWAFSPRISMPPGGVAIKATGGSVAYAWFVWDVAHPTARGDTRLDWLP